MAVGGAAVELDPARDTLVNVNAFGDPVPSARFMGGREFATLVGEGANEPSPEAILTRAGNACPADAVRAAGLRAVSETRKAEWIGGEPTGDARHVAASFYLAMMTATCLDLIGADGPTIVEGPFAAQPAVCRHAGCRDGATGHRCRNQRHRHQHRRRAAGGRRWRDVTHRRFRRRGDRAADRG